MPFCRPVHNIGSMDFLSGCCLAVKKNVFEKIGLFDKSYFLYYEDIDFSIRAKEAGFKFAIEPLSKVYHKVSYSLKDPASVQAVYYTIRNNLNLIKKFVKLPIGFVSYLYVFILSWKIVLWRFNREINASVYYAWRDFTVGKDGKRK